MDIEKLLDKCKEVCNARTDAELAEKLRVSKQAVSGWRNGYRLPDVVTCATIAGLTGEPLSRVIGIVEEARAATAKEKAVWRRLATSAATLAVLLGANLLPGTGARVAHAQDKAAFRIAGADCLLCQAAKAFLTFWRDVLLWLRCCFGRTPTGPHIEAMTA